MPKNPVKPKQDIRLEPKSGLSVLYSDDGIVHIQKARKLTIKERKNYNKNNNFVLDEIKILFYPSADISERPKVIFTNRKHI